MGLEPSSVVLCLLPEVKDPRHSAVHYLLNINKAYTLCTLSLKRPGTPLLL